MFGLFHSGSVVGSFIHAAYQGDVFKMNSIAKRSAPFDFDATERFVHSDSGTCEPATALIVSARHGVIYSVEYLISKGANVDKQASEGGNTALMEAARGGHLKVVAALVEAGADPQLRNKDGKTAGDLAKEAEYGLVARVIERPGSVTVMDIATYTRSHLPRQKSLSLRPLGCWGKVSACCLS
jgi:ankyrin repeat protein